MKILLFVVVFLTIVLTSLHCAEKYAVLICGCNPEEEANQPSGQFGGLNRHRFEEFWYDTFLMWEMLIDKGYTDNNIFVIFGDNTDENGLLADWYHIGISERYQAPMPLQRITDYKATNRNINTVFDGLANGDIVNGIPQIHDDDFLFIWTFGHGGIIDTSAPPELRIPGLQIIPENPDVPEYYDAATLNIKLDNIHCQKKVVWTQQCNGGSFIEFLNHNGTLNNLIINTSCTDDLGSVPCDDRFRHNQEPQVLIDGLENEHIPSFEGEDYNHGEFDFHMYSATNQKTPSSINNYNGISLSECDVNNDGIISINESRVWEQNHESGSETPEYWELDTTTCSLGMRTSLDYPNLLFENICNTRTIKGIVAITDNVSITNNSILTIQSGTKLYLKNDSRLLVDAGSSIIIEDNVYIYGETATQFENTPQEIAGNRIIVNGSVSIGDDVIFTSLNDQSWDGLYLYGTGQSELIDVTFEDCNLFCANGSVLVRDSNFDQSSVSCSGASMDFRNCNITGKMAFNNALEAILDHVTVIGNDNSLPTVKVSNTPSLTLKNNTYISGLGGGLELNSCRDYSITNCNISNNTGNGISIYETNGMYNYMISDCDISHNIGAGIRFYNSIGNVTSCSITENDYQGISAFRVSNLTIQKDPNTAAYYRDCYIANNGMQEISFVNSTNLFADRAKNMIVDNSFTLGTFDQYLVYCPHMESNRWLRLNFWGYRDNHSVAIMPPENRFYPECTEPMFNEVGYYLSPVWDPGIPRIVDPDNDEIVFQTAIDAALDENASLAITLFKQLISEYPESKFSSASAKHLFALEDDKQALKDYYQTEPNLHYNGEIDKIIDYLTTHCNIKLGNYQEAIAWFEDVISNPESEIDSLMAVIDLGYIYMLMEGDNKASVICRYPQLIPKTMSEYETNRESILVNLFGTAENQAGYTDSEYTQQSIMPVLRSNFPNPFNPSTTISFLLPKDANCTLEVYNIRGQKVKTLINETRFAGNHSVVWNGLDDNGQIVSSGLYFYRLTTPYSSQTNKMLLLK